MIFLWKVAVFHSWKLGCKVLLSLEKTHTHTLWWRRRERVLLYNLSFKQLKIWPLLGWHPLMYLVTLITVRVLMLARPKSRVKKPSTWRRMERVDSVSLLLSSRAIPVSPHTPVALGLTFLSDRDIWSALPVFPCLPIPGHFLRPGGITLKPLSRLLLDSQPVLILSFATGGWSFNHSSP